MNSKVLKGALTVVGAVVVSTIGIYASDSLQGVDRSLVGLSGLSQNEICRSGMVPMKSDGSTLCVDMYESSPSDDCPHTVPASTFDTEENAKSSTCYAASVPKAMPWRFISLPQAQRMCAAGGKRLPTNDEWYHLAIGAESKGCIVNEQSAQQSGSVSCTSSVGALDTIGNVWEWVDETVVDLNYGGRKLPEEGYVDSVDSSGIAITSTDAPVTLYGDDYFWSEIEGTYGMIRGGFYGSGADAGLYTVNASVQTSFASQGVGFRCVEDLF